MSTVNNGPQIVRNGLILDLDASSVTSYSAISVYKVECYSTFGGGLRSANYTVQYSDDNSTWTTAFTGVMSNNSSCGIITGTNRNDSNYSKHRYWRYVEGGAVVGHHPRVARIDFITKSGAVYNLVTYTTDNCADSGTYIVGTVSKDFGTTTWRDTSGNGNNGTINGATFNSANKGAIVFDGVDDYIDLNSNNIITGLNPFTFEAFYKLSGAGNAELFGNYGSGYSTNYIWISGRYGLFINGGYPYFQGYPLSTGTYHMAVTRDSAGACSLYKNGVLDGTATNTVSIPVGLNFRIGSDVNGLAELLNGEIYSMRVYNRTLSATEIFNNYQTTKARFGL